jgi:SAM-dependent methyltransferase
MIDRTLNYGREHISAFAKAHGPCTTALDVGAGSGADLDLVKAATNCDRLIAIEGYPEYQEILRQKGFSVHGLDIERDAFPLEDESVDLIVINQVAEHLKDIWWAWHQMSRVLRTGGSLIVGVPNLASLHNRALLAIGRQPTSIQNSSAHVRGWTGRDLDAFLEAGFPRGYERLARKGSNFYPFPAPIAKVLAKAAPSMAWGTFTHYRKSMSYSGGFLRYPTEERLETSFFLGTPQP